MKCFPRTSERNCLHVHDNARCVSRGARISIDMSRSSDSAPNGEWEKASEPWLFGVVNGVNSGVLMAWSQEDYLSVIYVVDGVIYVVDGYISKVSKCMHKEKR